MSPEQANELVSGMDTRLHHHTEDRVTLHQLQANERIVEVAADYTASYNDDYLFVDATSAVAVDLPLARNNIITVVRVAGANNVTLTPDGTDLINGGASLVISTSYAPRRFKGMPGVGYIEV